MVEVREETRVQCSSHLVWSAEHCLVSYVHIHCDDSLRWYAPLNETKRRTMLDASEVALDVLRRDEHPVLAYLAWLAPGSLCTNIWSDRAPGVC